METAGCAAVAGTVACISGPGPSTESWVPRWATKLVVAGLGVPVVEKLQTGQSRRLGGVIKDLLKADIGLSIELAAPETTLTGDAPCRGSLTERRSGCFMRDGLVRVPGTCTVMMCPTRGHLRYQTSGVHKRGETPR